MNDREKLQQVQSALVALASDINGHLLANPPSTGTPPGTSTPTPPSGGSSTPAPSRGTYEAHVSGDMVGASPTQAGSGFYSCQFSDVNQEHVTEVSLPWDCHRAVYSGNPPVSNGEVGIRLQGPGWTDWYEVSNGQGFDFTKGSWKLKVYSKDVPPVKDRGTGIADVYFTIG